VIAADPRGKHIAFPCAGGDFETLKLCDRRRQPGASLPLGAGCDSLPAQHEAHEVLCGDRLDLTPQTLLRIAVNAQQQAARARLLSLQRWIEVAPKREALGLEPRERDGHGAEWQST